MRKMEFSFNSQVGFSQEGAPPKGQAPGRASLHNFSVADTRLVAAREARNASGREWMTRVDGGEGAERDTRDAASVSSGEAWEPPHRSSLSDPTPREIEDHVLTGHARFRSWCAACAEGRGRAEGHRGDGPQRGRGRLWNSSSVMELVFLWDGVTQLTLAYVIPAKGVYLPSCEKVVDVSTQRFGRFGVLLSGVSVSRRALHFCTAQETAAENDPQSNGAAESSVHVVTGDS